jgi:hypothetical protein
MFVAVELLYGTQGKREGKEDDRASVISHIIKVEDIRMCIENC